MGSLLLIMGGAERRLPEQDVHYLWMDGSRLRVSANPPSAEVCIGHFVCEFGPWSFYTGPSECPRELRINGRPVTERDVSLPADRAEVRLAGEPYSEPPPREERPAPRSTADARPAAPWGGAGPVGGTGQRVIGPPGTDAHYIVDDPLVRPDHARVEVDARGAWWVTAHNGEVYVDGERVDWTVREPGTRFTVGRRTLTVPGRGGRRAGKALGVELVGVTVRRGDRALLDNVTLSVPAGDFVAVVGQNQAGPQLLLGLVAGGQRPDRGTVRVGGSSRRGDPAVRCVPPADDLHGTLTVREVLGFAAALRFGAGEAAAKECVDEALSWLGLEAEADRWVRTLTEPQRKRLSVAAEVVHRPGLLLVPQSQTSHEIGRDGDLMSRLRTVGRDTNCTIVVATQSVGGLDGADLVVVLDAKGRLRFAGPPGQPLANQPDLTWAEWVATLDLPDGEPDAAKPPPASRPRCETVIRSEDAFAGMSAALARQWLLFWRRGPGALAALPLLPVLGAILVALLLDGPAGLLAVAVLTGLSVGRIELVTERAELARDRRAGFGTGALMAAKLVVGAAVCAVLAVPAGVTAAIAGVALPEVPGVPPWGSAWLLLWLVMVLSLGAGALAAAVTRTLPAAVAASAALVPVQVLLVWFLFAFGWVPALFGTVALGLASGRLAAAVLETRLQP